MNEPLKCLFERIRIGSVEEQNSAIGTLVEILRKYFMRDSENYAYAFLKPDDPLFTLALSEDEKGEIIHEIDLLICSESGESPKRASLIWALGSSNSWQGLERLLALLKGYCEQMSDEECYQAFCSLDNLLDLGSKDQAKLEKLLSSYGTRQIIICHATRIRVGLSELAADLVRRIERL